MLLLIPVAVLAVVGLIKAERVREHLPKGDPSRGSLIRTIVMSASLLLLGLPALWFGNIPFFLVTGETGLNA